MQATLQARAGAASSVRAGAASAPRRSLKTVAVLRSSPVAAAAPSSPRRFVPALSPSTRRPVPSFVDGGVAVGARVSDSGGKESARKGVETRQQRSAARLLSFCHLKCSSSLAAFQEQTLTFTARPLCAYTPPTTGCRPPWSFWSGTAGAGCHRRRRGADFR